MPCRRVFPDIYNEFLAVIERLAAASAMGTIAHPDTRAPTQVVLSRQAFVDAVRLLMYSSANARQLPLLIHQSYYGDYAP